VLLRVLDRALADLDGPRPGVHVLVAVSGGPDSTALLAALVARGAARGLLVSAAHVDHGLRGAESAADRAAVEALAARLGVSCRTVVAPVPPGGNLEARARQVRHRALGALADEVGAARIALAHTEDDQVETVLLRLLRGAGRRGLGGMASLRGRLWRPLLAATRADVRRYLADEDLPFRLDRTNADLGHARNRLRRLVLPLLAREFNPRLGASVAALAARLRDEEAFLRNAAAVRMPVHRREAALAVSVGEEPPALARRIVRAWLDDAGPRGVAAREVERVLALARGRAHGNVAVPGPARVVREGDVLVRRAGRDAAVVPGFHHELRPGERLDGPDGVWHLTLSSVRPRRDDDLVDLSSRRARFDAGALAWPLVVRGPARGDRIDVPGVGSKKLQDVFVDAKLPRERRAATPVVTDASGRLVWVPGVVRGGAALLDAASTHVVEATYD